jgi:hypothetical protein
MFKSISLVRLLQRKTGVMIWFNQKNETSTTKNTKMQTISIINTNTLREQLLNDFFSIPPLIGHPHIDDDTVFLDQLEQLPSKSSSSTEGTTEEQHNNSNNNSDKYQQRTTTKQTSRRKEYYSRKRKPLFKPTPKPICKFYLESRCAKGNDCPFRHEGEQIPKADFCKYFLVGECHKGEECPYSHHLKEFPCRYFFLQGGCDKGDKCRFSHDKDEIRPERLAKMKDVVDKQNQEKLAAQQKAIDPPSIPTLKEAAIAIREAVLNTNTVFNFGSVFDVDPTTSLSQLVESNNSMTNDTSDNITNS